MTHTVFFPGLGLEFELNRVLSVFGHEVSVFGRSIYWYGIIIAAGFLLAVIYGLWRAPRFSMDPDVITDAIFVVVPSAIVGARLYYVIFNPSVCFDQDGSFSLLRAIAFWDGGLAIYGGVIATVIAAVIIARVRKASFWSGMDITAYGLLIGQAIGRWGNFVNVECYGAVTALPWRMSGADIANDLVYRNLLTFDSEVYRAICDGTLGVHPTFFYESLWNALGFVLLVLLAKKGRKFNGQMFLSYIVWYGAGRAAIEGMRTDSLYFFGTGIRSSQLLGILSAAAGVALYVYRMKTAGPADPPFVKGQAEAAAAVEAPPEEAGEPAAAEADAAAEEAGEPAAVEAEAAAEEPGGPAAAEIGAAAEEPGEPAAVEIEAAGIEAAAEEPGEPAAPEEETKEEKSDGGNDP